MAWITCVRPLPAWGAVAQSARLPDDPGGARREPGAAFLLPCAAENAEVVEGSWQTSSQISLYLRKDLPEQSILDMQQRILLYPGRWSPSPT